MEQEKMKTMSQLVANGWNRELLMRIAHMPQTPFFRTSKRGKFYVFESKLREFASERRCGK